MRESMRPHLTHRHLAKDRLHGREEFGKLGIDLRHVIDTSSAAPGAVPADLITAMRSARDGKVEETRGLGARYATVDRNGTVNEVVNIKTRSALALLAA